MPKIRRRHLPTAVLEHLLLRAKQRQITVEQLQLLYQWLALDVTVPESSWYKRFGDFVICGEGEIINTSSISGQVPHGIEVD